MLRICSCPALSQTVQSNSQDKSVGVEVSRVLEQTLALAVVAKMLSPTYQSMIREASTALEAWEALKAFFVKQSLHNRVQLRKKLHEFTLGSGEELITHIVRFDDLCARLAAVGEKMTDDEKVVILLGSLPQEYDTMIRIIESQEHVTLLDTKEMLRREAVVIQKRDTKEQAFRVSIHGRRNRGRGRGNGRRGGYNRGGGRGGGSQPWAGNGKSEFRGTCYECKQQGHKKANCPSLKENSSDEYVFFSLLRAR
ncbi:unnamed protein product [Phytophthora lilii]|uniref:Unnamed protein product n=1 Tax=Phytophthora lilii TaxID=2077276 RepID=A0A9W6YJ92_9STRA|nr:unnamed protein product [Phytophthora lilii]